MKLKINNRDGSVIRDYTRWLDGERAPKVLRKLNEGSELEVWLVCEAGRMIVPKLGARVFLLRDDDTIIFSGYMPGSAEREFVGAGVERQVLRYRIAARGEEIRLDRKPLPECLRASGCTAGNLLRAVTEDACDLIDTSRVQEIADVGVVKFPAGTRWSEAAKQIADSARASWRAENDCVTLVPIGSNVYTLSEADPTFAPDGLDLQQCRDVVNEIAIQGGSEPEMYVKDYFVGDGHTLRFAMSMMPFLRSSEMVLEEEYSGSELSRQRWLIADENGSLSVGDGKLKLSGTPQATGRAWVCLAEQLELGGGLVLEHGATTVNGDGVLGGIYARPLGASVDGADLLSDCVAGFAVMSQGGVLRAVIGGAAIGPTFAMQVGHRYVLRTRVFSAEAYRVGQIFRSSADERRAAGAESNSVRFVLEVQDIDPADPASQVREAIVLYDGVVANAPALATYAVVNGSRLCGEISYTRIRRTEVAEVSVTSADGLTRSTKSMGMLSDGAHCSITAEPALYFYSPYKPATDETIVVRYRSSRHAGCRVSDGASIASHMNVGDAGVRAAVCRIRFPQPRTTEDCEAAAMAALDDSVKLAWLGKYTAWSDFLPQNAKDLYPGDVLQIDLADIGESLSVVIREVGIEMIDPANDRGRITLRFANEAAAPICLGARGISPDPSASNVVAASSLPVSMDRSSLGNWPASLPSAEVVEVRSNSVTIDAGDDPPAGGGFEVRSGGDWSWGATTDRNLLGRFTIRRFDLPKNERGQDYYVRMYDGATPRNYSRRTTLLHVDVKQ